MKKPLLFFVVILFASCQKKNDTINNYTTPSQPAFAVNGINDVSLTNNLVSSVAMSLAIQYLDSTQEDVTLAVTGLPAGISIDTTWVHRGIPSFNTTLTIEDTTGAGAAPGTYSVAVTATTPSGSMRSYPFNITIHGMPTAFLGKYNNCMSFCLPSGPYTDSLYADPSVPNKIWFSNFANSGTPVYALITGFEQIIIPAQVVGGNTISTITTTSYIDLTSHQFNIQINEGSGTCNLELR